MVLIFLTIFVGPIIFFVPFINAVPIDEFHGKFFTGIFDFLGARVLDFNPPISRPFLIAGFVISLLMIFNLFKYDQETAKIPLWAHRILRLIALIGSALGLVGALLQIKLYLISVPLYPYHTLTLSVGFYISVIIFGLIFLGIIGQIISEEVGYQRWKRDNPLPIENP